MSNNVVKELAETNADDSIYEGHSDIIDTPLAFWTPDGTNNSAHGKVKREDWNGRKREKLG